MKTNFTAGPWSVQYYDFYLSDGKPTPCEVDNPDGQNFMALSAHIRGADGLILGQVKGFATDLFVDPEMVEGNARLIAAAPDMLEALQKAAELLVKVRPYLPKSIKNAMRFEFENVNANVIRKAIRKAIEPCAS